MKKWISCITIFMISLSLSACNAVVEKAADNELSDDKTIKTQFLESKEQAEKGTVGIIHRVASVPEERNFTDKWFGTSEKQLVCVDLKTKEVSIVWDFSEEDYYDIQFVHNGSDIYAIGKIYSEQEELRPIWKINMENFDREKIEIEQFGAVGILCAEQTLYLQYRNREQTRYVSYKIDEKGGLEKLQEEDGVEDQEWILHPLYMDDVYGYRLYYEAEKNKVVALDSESGHQEYLTGELDSFDNDNVIAGNAYIVIKEYSNSDFVEIISLEEGTIRPILVSGEPYQITDKWLYYVVETDVQNQLWCMNVETGEYHQLTVEECKKQRVPDRFVFETFRNGYGTYLCRCDNWQEWQYNSSKELLTRIYNTHVDDIGIVEFQELKRNCDACGEPMLSIDISTIYFENKIKTEKKLVEAAMKFQQDYVDKLMTDFQKWNQYPSEYIDMHFKEENGLCESGYGSMLSYGVDISYIDKNYLCLEMNYYEFWYRAAHGYGESDCVTYARQTGEELLLADIVDYTEEEWKDIVRTAFMEEEYYYVDSDGTIWDTIEERLGFDMKFALTGEGIWIYFDRYEVAGYAAGEPSVTIPYDKLALKIELHPEQYKSLAPIPD